MGHGEHRGGPSGPGRRAARHHCAEGCSSWCGRGRRRRVPTSPGSPGCRGRPSPSGSTPCSRSATWSRPATGRPPAAGRRPRLTFNPGRAWSWPPTSAPPTAGWRSPISTPSPGRGAHRARHRRRSRRRAALRRRPVHGAAREVGRTTGDVRGHRHRPARSGRVRRRAGGQPADHAGLGSGRGPPLSPSASPDIPVLVDNDVNVMALGGVLDQLARYRRRPAVRQDRHRHRLRVIVAGEVHRGAQGTAGRPRPRADPRRRRRRLPLRQPGLRRGGGQRRRPRRARPPSWG